MYVTNFTASSLDGVPYALALAQDHDAELKFVHVAEESPMRPFHFGNSRIVAFRKQLESLVASGNGLLQGSEFVVQEGDRAEGLVRIAANLHANLIVMSARGIPGKTSPYCCGLLLVKRSAVRTALYSQSGAFRLRSGGRTCPK